MAETGWTWERQAMTGQVTTYTLKGPSEVLCRYWYDRPPSKEAHLIAAAPDMAEALERIARPHGCGCKPCTGQCTSQEALAMAIEGIRELASTALARARGQEQERK